MDLSGLPETAVDSEEDDDEEDIERASDPLMSRDIVRDCLEKDPMDRTDDDIGERPVRGCNVSQHMLMNHTIINSAFTFKNIVSISVHALELHLCSISCLFSKISVKNTSSIVPG